ncbi:MAG: Cell division protein DivIB [Firmicutes bacterium ADurb.Bin193]|nr:MAG: Cell division protein DivIB [Firmicutes bacterium ADurb.Bin193]
MDYISKTTYDGRNVRVKDYKKRIRRNRRRRKILFFSFVLLCVIMFFRLTPFFNIKHITCTGNIKVSVEEIISVSTIGYNYNLFKTSISKAEKLIKTIPYVSDVKVKRKFPNKIEINVTESEICGYIPLSGGYIYIDKNCKMLEYRDTPPEQIVPVVENTGVLTFESGRQLVADDEDKVKSLTAVFNALISNSVLEKTAVIDVLSVGRIKFLYNNSLEIIVGDIKDIDYKISFALRAIKERIGENTRGTLDVSDPKTGTILSERN